MRKLLPIAFASIVLAVSAVAQPAQKTFDNFDTAQGVTVYLPPAPPESSTKAKTVRRKRGGKWVVEVSDPLVKKTVQSRHTRPVVIVTDGLAAREMALNINRTSLVMGSASGLNGFTTGNQLHDSLIVESSRRYNIDPLLIYSQMHQESTFKTNARSPKGASGLMQLMPGTARRFGVTRIYDPKQNIDAGVKYMRWLLDTFNGDVVLALAGYNAGEGAVMKYGWNVPPYRETREYVRRISARYNAISNSQNIASAKMTKKSSAEIAQREKKPLTVWEPTPLAIRTQDGKMMLVNQ